MPAFWAQWICSTWPFEPVNSVVEIAKSREPPSFRAYGTRSFIGHSGHGVTSSGRERGGSPISSIWVTDAAPSRWAFATQSAPVSPPPITITSLPAAVITPGPEGGSGAPGIIGPSSRATKRLRW